MYFHSPLLKLKFIFYPTIWRIHHPEISSRWALTSGASSSGAADARVLATQVLLSTLNTTFFCSHQHTGPDSGNMHCCSMQMSPQRDRGSGWGALSTERRPEANKGEFALNHEDNGGRGWGWASSPDKQDYCWFCFACAPLGGPSLQRAESATRGVSQNKKCLTLGHSHKERSEPNSIKDREISN